MAEAFLQVVLDNLSSLIKKEIGLIMGVDNEMNKLSSTLTTIQAVLEDAEQKQLESKPIQNWLCKLNDLAYEIDDILDECATQVSIMEHRRSSRYSLKKILFRRKIGRRMKQVTAKLDDVVAEHEKFHLREMPIDRPREVAASRETGSTLNESHHVYGREEDKEKIVDILVNHVRDNQETSVLPIIGIGGLGKTTLAQLVFNDQRVVEHFDKKLWVCVSDNFDLKTLIKSMIESLTGTGSASDLTQLDTLQRHLWELLNQKRYLLVLDDVWNDHQEKWYALRNVLACGSAGASIIVTTRQKKVADIMGTLEAHNLTGLSEEQCWLLLRERAFGHEEKEYPNLEVIGKEIVKKCAGVPLAAKALGGLLRFKRTEKDWIYVKESEILDLPQEETLILPALRLSYHHLPLELRQCFAYCAVFPKDSRIDKKELIFNWIAHGFISSRGVLEVEDVGDEVCNELVLRSLLQVAYTLYGNIFFIMHDLVHDLAQSIMENKVPGTQNVRSASNSKIRQVTLLKKYVAFPTSNQLEMDMSSILMNFSRPEMDMSYILTNFSRLRILDASYTEIEELSSAVGNLKHLRHLNLSFTNIRTLPDSLGSLWKLRILNLNHCSDLVALPKSTRCLKNLRHLFLEGCTSLSEMPSKISDLTDLRTLSLFIVGHNRGNQLDELQCLNLGGELEIRHLERLKNPMDAKKANLGEKKNLRHLRLVWNDNNGSRLMEDVHEKVLEALEPHPNVETLEINGSNGRLFPFWRTNSPKLNLTQNCLRLPYLRELPHLKILRLENLGIEYIVEDEVEGGDAVSTDFPSLEKLVLYKLPNLKGFFKDHVMREGSPNLREIDFIKGNLASLQVLYISICPMLISLPASIQGMTNLKSLTIWNCPELAKRCERGKGEDWHKIAHIPDVQIN